jgi:hypothetical protein
MSVYDSPDLLLADPAKIIDVLVSALTGGYLSVFVGAGVAMSTTQPVSGGLIPPRPVLPSWGGLVEECCRQVGLTFATTRSKENDYLLRMAEDVENACKSSGISFLDVVMKALYINCARYDETLLKCDLLIALGSLVMTSTRGSASVVVNYNFDDLLEWYLLLHGFTVSIVSDLPTLAQRADVVVYHPHGFLPKTDKLLPYRSQSLIFTKRSYQRAYKDSTPWNEFQRFRFGCNICLFVGLSGNDPHIEWLYSSVHDELHGNRILGILIVIDTLENRELEAAAKNRGVIQYYISDHSQLPNVILEICRRAAGT